MADEPTTPEPPAPPEPEKTLPQSQVNAIAARERAAGVKAAEAAVTDRLGASVDEVAAELARYREADKAAMSEADRKMAEAAEKIAAAEAATQRAAVAELRSRSERALYAVGLSEAAVNRFAGSLGLDVDATDDQIAAAVESLRADVPELFSGRPSPAAPSTKPADQVGARGKPSTALDSWELGKKDAEKYAIPEPIKIPTA